MSFANVVLLKVSDTTLIKGASADENGRFLLSDISPDLYYLQARYFGYRSSLTPLDINQDVTIGALFMEPENVWMK